MLLEVEMTMDDTIDLNSRSFGTLKVILLWQNRVLMYGFALTLNQFYCEMEFAT